LAGSAFSDESVTLKDGVEVSLPSYAKMMNIEIHKASDFNTLLHERGCDKKVTVQKVCEFAKDENEVRDTLDRIWNESGKAHEILRNIAVNNRQVYELEEKLENL